MSKIFWNAVYFFYPPLLRILEKLRIHSERQDFLIGFLKSEFTSVQVSEYLIANEYENAVLAWKDPGELLSMRKIDRDIFQYHVRLFSDGEFRCHYEYSSEGNPWNHVNEIGFEAKTEVFKELLKDFI